MSRSDYVDDPENNWSLICWCGAVKSAMRGKRGQAFLKEMLAALEAMPEKRLITNDLEALSGEVCAIGAVGKARGVDMSDLDPYEYETVASRFGIAEALTREIVYMNDEWGGETPEQRWSRMRNWIKENIKTED